MKILFSITIFLLLSPATAQQVVKKEVAFYSQKISVQLQNVDEIKLFHNSQDKVMVSMENRPENPYSLSIKSSGSLIDINSSKLNIIEASGLEKYCTVQPLFSSYSISIPKGADITIYYDEGNFSTHNFEGNLTLRLNKGALDLDDFIGTMDIELFSGNVWASIQSAQLDILSNSGRIKSELVSEKLEQTTTTLRGIYKDGFNKFKVRTIHANIAINKALTQ